MDRQHNKPNIITSIEDISRVFAEIYCLPYQASEIFGHMVKLYLIIWKLRGNLTLENVKQK